jgi:arylsulfatase A-like enzyme
MLIIAGQHEFFIILAAVTCMLNVMTELKFCKNGLPATGMLSAALSLTACISPGEPAQVFPNVILINIDDMGWRDVGFMGTEYYETPNLDALAARGIIFTNAYAAASNCAPSRASMLTGQWTPRHGIYTVDSSERGRREDRRLIPVENRTVLPENHLIIAQVLSDSGFATCHAGKWHISADPAGHGFDVNIGGSGSGNPGSYYPPYKNVPLEAPSDDYYLTDLIMDKAIEFLQDAGSRPFFLHYAPYAVHTPIHPVRNLLPGYINKQPWNGQDNAEYATMVENLDHQIGRLISFLEGSGRLENTFILFISDNGGHYGITSQLPLRSGKGSYYEGGIRVPMFAFWKGKIPPGQISDVPVTMLDIYPTLLDISGAGNPEGRFTDGLTLLPLFTGTGTIEERPLFWHFPVYLEAYPGKEDPTQDPLFRTRPGSAIRKGDWKLIQYFEYNDLELYNLKEDIDEKNNLARENPARVNELLEMLEKWREEVNAPVPVELNPYYKTSI